MKVGVWSLDSVIPNLALMKVSAYHKAKGDEVVQYLPLFDDCDLVYISKVFESSKLEPYYQREKRFLIGGPGYSYDRLPADIDSMFPDYSIFNCDYAIGFTHRGCIRKCPFCKVRKMEGKISELKDINTFWNGQDRIKLLDNNLTATPKKHWEKILNQLIESGAQVDFNQGLDARIISDDFVNLLSKVKLWKNIHSAWDNVKDEKLVLRGIEKLLKKISGANLMFYVLVGFNSTEEEDLYRLRKLKSLKVRCYVMPFNHEDEYQSRLASWVNGQYPFWACDWKDFNKNPDYWKKVLDNVYK